MVVLIVLGWLYRQRLEDLIHPLLQRKVEMTSTVPVSPALAAQAQDKLARLAEGRASRITLGSAELQSLLRYRYQQLLPAFVDSPVVELQATHLRIRARIPVERLPRLADLGEAANLLPDTTDVTVTGEVLPLDSGRVALAVDAVSVAVIPLPRRMIPPALQRLGRHDEPGLPPDALAVPLPPGAAAAYVRGDSLVLLGPARAPGPP